MAHFRHRPTSLNLCWTFASTCRFRAVSKHAYSVVLEPITFVVACLFGVDELLACTVRVWSLCCLCPVLQLLLGAAVPCVCCAELMCELDATPSFLCFAMAWLQDASRPQHALVSATAAQQGCPASAAASVHSSIQAASSTQQHLGKDWMQPAVASTDTVSAICQ